MICDAMTVLRTAGPTLQDLTYDDTLDDVDRCVTYSASAIALQRLVHARLLADAARGAGFTRLVSSILPLLDPLSDDDEKIVRLATAEQLPGIALTLVQKGGDAGYQHVMDTVLPAVGRLLTDPDEEVRTAACDALVAVAESVVRRVDLGLRVLTLVLGLAHEEEDEVSEAQARVRTAGLERAPCRCRDTGG